MKAPFSLRLMVYSDKLIRHGGESLLLGCVKIIFDHMWCCTPLQGERKSTRREGNKKRESLKSTPMLIG